MDARVLTQVEVAGQAKSEVSSHLLLTSPHLAAIARGRDARAREREREFIRYRHGGLGLFKGMEPMLGSWEF